MARSDSGWDIEAVDHGYYDADGFLQLQVAVEGSKPVNGLPPRGAAKGYEVLHPAGLYHVPLAAGRDQNGNLDPSKAAQSICFREGGHVVAIPSSDPRVIPLLPQLGDGDTLVYGGAGAFVRITGSNNAANDNASTVGRISMWTTDTGDTKGNTVALRCWPDRHQRAAAWGTETFDATGYHLALTSGPCFDLGGMGGSAVPAGYGSYALLRADSVKLDSKTVQLGPTGAYSPVALAVPLEAELAALTSAVAAFGAAVTTLTNTVATAMTAGAALAVSEPGFAAAAAALNPASLAPVVSAVAAVVSAVNGIYSANASTHPLCSKSTVAT